MMRTPRVPAALAAGAAFAIAAFAVAAWAAEPTLRVTDAFARAMPPGARTAGAYLSIENRGPDDRLVSATSARAAAVELHAMSEEGGVMRMRPVPGIPVAAGQTVRLTPGGLHLMLIDPKPPLKEGEHIPLTLRFEKGGNVGADLVVQGAGAMAMPGH